MSDQSDAERRDAVLKRLLDTPPKPQGGPRKPKRKKKRPAK